MPKEEKKKKKWMKENRKESERRIQSVFTCSELTARVLLEPDVLLLCSIYKSILFSLLFAPL